MKNPYYERLIEIRRELHRQPELSGEEVETTKKIRAWLTEHEIQIEDLPLKTGLVATIQGSEAGPTIALRADIDALPIEEEAEIDFRSEIPGKMHGCGHDFHTANLIGAAWLLKDRQAELKGTVKLIFQPAEETGVGAKQIIEAGGLEGVDLIIGCHNNPDLPVGTVGFKAGSLMAAIDTIEINIEGVGGHGALPERTADPVVAASAVVMALQTAVSRNTTPHAAAVVSICSLQAGTTHNVIPPKARLYGTMRTYNQEVREALYGHIERLATNVAAGYGCTAQVTITPDLPPVDNDAAVTELLQRAAQRLNLTVVEGEPTMGGEDFAVYQQQVPGSFFWIGTGNQAQGIVHAWHHPKFMVDEGALEHGPLLFVEAALEALATWGN